jgi:hypothetical protein
VTALREDPSYLADTIKEYEDHTDLEKLFELPGRPNKYRLHIIRRLVTESYPMLACWYQLDADLASFDGIQEQGTDMACQDHRLAAFICTTMVVLQNMVPMMCSTFLETPPMRGVPLVYKEGTGWQA